MNKIIFGTASGPPTPAGGVSVARSITGCTQTHVERFDSDLDARPAYPVAKKAIHDSSGRLPGRARRRRVKRLISNTAAGNINKKDAGSGVGEATPSLMKW